ncbi:hypothetical protein M5C72_00715 [Companilactobacillus allii]|uniref:WxL domain-containing protein n=1 Tax=Companilactobacillus allii TaxID=1847728 RepID=A0A1P8Q1K1_9LACO|nr:hypothetical protein [Companilactobacillus allii]APX71701.1 hypothetical protein BTM29_03640 [Companilactobacillus allii]USQ68789.1 hypothetical protein M5C72_00715 [Companilactobacillus allii]
MAKRKFLKYTSIIFFQLIIVLTAFALNTKNIQAEETPSYLTEIPPGMDYNQVKSKIFVTDTASKTLITGDKNGSGISNNAFGSPVNGVFPAFIDIGGTNSPQGTLWSTDDTSFDVTKSHTISMWTYFNTEPIDGGLAFVLQNDPRGVQALSTVTSDSKTALAPVETLGVWASDQNNLTHVSGAIQNSWALEMDTSLNNSGLVNDSFDDGLSTTGNMHIAAGYPGMESSYTPLSNGAYKLNHTDPDYHLVSGEGSGYFWHHLEITFNPNGDGTANVTYKFNDKNLDGSKNTNTGTETATNPIASSNTFKIDLSNFNLKDGQKLRWGLVGRGTSKSISTLESVDTLVDAGITTDTIDTTQDKTLSGSNDYVNAGDNMTLRYNLKYKSGKVNWANIYSKIKIPANLTVTGGIINYSNGTSESLNASEVSNGTLAHQLSQSLNSSNDTATVDVYATTPSLVTKDTKVNGEVAAFFGDTYAGNVTTQDFTIRNNVTKDLNISSTSPTSTSIKKSDSATINGNLKYGNGSDFDSYGVDLYVNIDGKDQDTTQITPDTDKSELNFSEVLSGTTLGVGTHTVKIYAKDSYGNTSQTLTFTITVEDKYANVAAADDLKFQNMTSNYVGIVKRDGDWNIKVTTANSPWELTATAKKLVGSDGDDFDGSIIYKNGSSIQSMQDQIVRIGGSTEAQTGTIDIGKEYWKDSNDGVLLQSNAGDKKSPKYTGVITWTLTDDLEND